ncbi:hypothetical protein GOB39_22270 [Sinorhizobium meliloti]|nr:hypothetical protein [Sinorhizobium meliloti]
MVNAARPLRAFVAAPASVSLLRVLSLRTGAAGAAIIGGGGATGSAFSIFGCLGRHIVKDVLFLLLEYGNEVINHPLRSEQSPKLAVGNVNVSREAVRELRL